MRSSQLSRSCVLTRRALKERRPAAGDVTELLGEHCPAPEENGCWCCSCCHRVLQLLVGLLMPGLLDSLLGLVAVLGSAGPGSSTTDDRNHRGLSFNLHHFGCQEAMSFAASLLQSAMHALCQLHKSYASVSWAPKTSYGTPGICVQHPCTHDELTASCLQNVN